MREGTISSAPVRFDIGAPTDLEELRQNGEEGAIINFALQPGVEVEIIPRQDRIISLRSENIDSEISFSLNDYIDVDGPLGLLKAAVVYTQPERGFDLIAMTDIPHGSGLGVSASLAVATLNGIKAILNGDHYSPNQQTLIDEAIMLEGDILGNTGGSQDQFAAVYGGINLLHYTPEGVNRQEIHLEARVEEYIKKNILIVVSEDTRRSGAIHDEVIIKYRRGDASIHKTLDQITSTVWEVKEALQKGDIARFGKLLTKAWELQKQLGKGITTESIEDIIAISLAHGAFGAKGLGAGGGGCVAVLCNEESRDKTRAELSKKYKILPLKITKSGVKTRKIESREEESDIV